MTSSDDAKLDRARALGADHAVNYRSGDVVREVRAAIGAADVVVDSVGAAVWDASFRLLEPGGRLVNAGATGGDRGSCRSSTCSGGSSSSSGRRWRRTPSSGALST